MSELIESLRKLQAVDAELYRLRNEQQQKPLLLERSQQLLAEEQAKAQSLEARLKASQIQHKAHELELLTQEANLKKLQAQLFQVKTNKEYTAMQHEIDQSKADVSLLEEEIIRVLDAIDQAKREFEAQAARVAQQHARAQAEEARIQAELQAIQSQIAQLERQRHTLTPSVRSEVLAVYERVLANRDGLALVPLVKDSCGGCHMVQPPQVINQVALGTKLVTCESCNRILYLEEAFSHHSPTG